MDTRTILLLLAGFLAGIVFSLLIKKQSSSTQPPRTHPEPSQKKERDTSVATTEGLQHSAVLASATKETSFPEKESSPSTIQEEKNSSIASSDQQRQIRSCDQPARIVITPEMEEALAALKKGHHIFIHGFAGTGKSTFIKAVKKAVEQAFIQGGVLIVAPTGIAAQNAEGATIHSIFEFRVEQNGDYVHTIPDCYRNEQLSPEKRNLLERTKLIIIDEISMVRADIFDCIVQTVQSINPRIQFCLVGDLEQLLPIINQKKIIPRRAFQGACYKSPSITSANCYNSLNLQHITFTHNFRQNETIFMSVLRRIRNKEITATDLNLLNKRARCCTGTSSAPPITLATKVKVVEKVNATFLSTLQNKKTYKAEYPKGSKPSMESMPPEHLTVGNNARVLFVKNNQPYWVNGTLGTLLSHNNAVMTVLLDSGETVQVSKEKFETYDYVINEVTEKIERKVVKWYRQFPLIPAWAITIHKAQGLSLDAVEINLAAPCFDDKQFYVAVSRCRKFHGLFFTKKITWKDIKISEYIPPRPAPPPSLSQSTGKLE